MLDRGSACSELPNRVAAEGENRIHNATRQYNHEPISRGDPIAFRPPKEFTLTKTLQVALVFWATELRIEQQLIVVN